jgi:hypothetical protein
MAIPRKGQWKGLLVCADRTIKVTMTLQVSTDGTLHGEYSFSDKKYSAQYSSGEMEGRYADNLVMVQLAGAQQWSASFHGHVHPAPPNKQQVLIGLVQVYTSKRGSDSGGLVLFSGLEDDGQLGGWDG